MLRVDFLIHFWSSTDPMVAIGWDIREDNLRVRQGENIINKFIISTLGRREGWILRIYITADSEV